MNHSPAIVIRPLIARRYGRVVYDNIAQCARQEPDATIVLAPHAVEKAIRRMRIARERYLRDDGRRKESFPNNGRPYYGVQPTVAQYMQEFCSTMRHIPALYTNGVTA